MWKLLLELNARIYLRRARRKQIRSEEMEVDTHSSLWQEHLLGLTVKQLTWHCHGLITLNEWIGDQSVSAMSAALRS